MPKSMWDAAARHALITRFAKLKPNDPPQWGRFTAHSMVVHLIDSARMALGTMPVRPARGAAAKLIGLPGPKHLFVYVLPFPRNAPTARELLTSPPGDWATDVATFTNMTEELAVRAANSRLEWPPHPFFGKMSARDWGVLGYRHTDHHLRQFGA
ncbi:MAG TPA: DinB family protein [Gemmatimonadaceae bacterium]|nr:DinB family protein [Gemmatimonadaceae bacterium]